jgi:hypothetical protein
VALVDEVAIVVEAVAMVVAWAAPVVSLVMAVAWAELAAVMAAGWVAALQCSRADRAHGAR